MTSHSGCPACSAKRWKVTAHHQVVECKRCGAIYTIGSMYLGDSYAFVLPYWADDPNVEGAKYFDLTCIGSDGLTRRHGWFDPVTRKITQVG